MRGGVGLKYRSLHCSARTTLLKAVMVEYAMGCGGASSNQHLEIVDILCVILHNFEDLAPLPYILDGSFEN